MTCICHSLLKLTIFPSNGSYQKTESNLSKVGKLVDGELRPKSIQVFSKASPPPFFVVMLHSSLFPNECLDIWTQWYFMECCNEKFQKPKTSWNFKTKHENISYMISYNQMEMNILQTQIANY